jgi:hypothetical protein
MINSLTEEDYYSKKEYIEKNYQTAIYYSIYFDRVENILNEVINLNKI